MTITATKNENIPARKTDRVSSLVNMANILLNISEMEFPMVSKTPKKKKITKMRIRYRMILARVLSKHFLINFNIFFFMGYSPNHIYLYD